MARPSKITEQHIIAVEEGLGLGLTHDLVSGHLGIHRATFYAWMSRGEKEEGTIHSRFYDAAKRGESSGALAALRSVQEASNGGTWQAGAWLLERRHGYRRDAPPVVEQAPEEPAVDATTEEGRQAWGKQLADAPGLLAYAGEEALLAALARARATREKGEE
jgi:hypothetical protein